MKQISNALKDHLSSNLTTLANLLKIVRTDGVIVALTDHDEDLMLEGVTYRADATLTDTKVLADERLQANDCEFQGILGSSLISHDDLKNGLYDHARIELSICNWQDVSQGKLVLRRGWLGDVVMVEGQFTASLRGSADLLSQKVGAIYTPECRFQLGDMNCCVDLSAYSVSGQVSSVIDARRFIDNLRSEPDDFFAHGTLTWVSGQNAGARFEVSGWNLSSQTISLWLPPNSAIHIGDTYTLSAGCDKRFATCCGRFSNGVNYGGFPYMPGLSKILQYPD